MALPARWRLFVGLAVIFLFNCINAQNPFRSFQYKYSFKPPYLAQKDGSVPFWGYTGNAIANEEMVRITPSLRSQKGQIWTSSPTNFDWWEVELVFRVTGRGRIGADGLALWYTESKGVEGPVFGSNDQWNGLGLFFDSFDNDNKHNNPFIMAMTNDGTQSYAHQLDGSTQQLAGCLRDFRNKPFPVRAKVEYYQHTLTVMFHNGMSNNEQDYEMCFRVENVVLPKNGYFGVTAATGGLADDHDALKFLTYNLQSPDSSVPGSEESKVAEDEREKLSKEYQEYQDKLQKQKEEYRQANPDAAKTGEENPEEWFETDSQRELGQIFSGQSKMFDALRDIQRKMDDIVGRQERTISLMSAIQSNQVGIAHPAGGAGQVPVTDTIRRHEVDTALANQREIVGAAREIKAYVTEIHQRSATIIQNQGKQQAVGSAQPIGYDHLQNSLNEIKEGINLIKRDISATAQRLAAQPVTACPTQNCLTTTIFAVFMVIQLVVMIGYFIYRDTKEAQAKKFY